MAFFAPNTSFTQSHSTPKIWTEQLLFAITNDFARPPVHARNLFHLSIAMYDAWAAIEPSADTYFLGKEFNGFQSNFLAFPTIQDSATRIQSQKEAISFAAYRLIQHRFLNAPGAFFTYQSIDSVMNDMGYDITMTSTNYLVDGPAALGNHIAQELIQYGLVDGSNEAGNFVYQYYQPANPPIEVELPGNPAMIDPNRWQPISLSNPIDQAGNPLPSTPLHLGPEWGNVKPFALTPNDITVYQREGNDYNVYLDPGMPPLLDTNTATGLEDFFKWNFVLVSVWQSHLDPSDNTLWDISPASMGNISSYPTNWGDYENFYDLFNGGENSPGHAINPITGLPYTPQIVKRGDYARVLAEFWADGLDSETPPGHWFNIYNEVSDHPLFERKWQGQGNELSSLEYDLRAYLTLGGAMHDAAIVAWSAKGWYDYPRPVSMIRYMADKGQSTDPLLPHFHPAGLPLISGYVELVEMGDQLAGPMNEHVDKIKLYTWRGHDSIFDPEEDVAGVGWILAENWWPYQRPSFVSPPFAGYVSGHSTYSSAAAEVFTFITGSPYFPGGMSNFIAEQDAFLEFENGPSETLSLQWATYKDAADQCSLSRLWGGIHPPIDDIPGRIIGSQSGQMSSQLGHEIVNNRIPRVLEITSNLDTIRSTEIGLQLELTVIFDSLMNTSTLPEVFFPVSNPLNSGLTFVNSSWISANTIHLTYDIIGPNLDFGFVHMGIKDAQSIFGTLQEITIFDSVFIYDTQAPELMTVVISDTVINNQYQNEQLTVHFYFSEDCKNLPPTIEISPSAPLSYTFSISPASQWISTSEYLAVWDIELFDPIQQTLSISLEDVFDAVGNTLSPINEVITVEIDTEAPYIIHSSVNQILFNETTIGTNALQLEVEFSRAMNLTELPTILFHDGSTPINPVTLNSVSSLWTSSSTVQLNFDLPANQEAIAIDLIAEEIKDAIGNISIDLNLPHVISIDTKKPFVNQVNPISDTADIHHYMNQNYSLDITYNEPMNTTIKPLITPQYNGSPFIQVAYSPFSSNWISDTVYRAYFTLPSAYLDQAGIYFRIQTGRDLLGNLQVENFSDTTISIYYDPETASLQAMSPHKIRLFPNPIIKGGDLRLMSDKPMTEIRIVDSFGRLIHEQNHINSTEHTLNTSRLSSGIYQVLVHTSIDIQTKRFIIYE